MANPLFSPRVSCLLNSYYLFFSFFFICLNSNSRSLKCDNETVKRGKMLLGIFVFISIEMDFVDKYDLSDGQVAHLLAYGFHVKGFAGGV